MEVGLITNSEFEINRNDDRSFTISIGNVNYQLNFNNKPNIIQFFCKTKTDHNAYFYEGSFTMEDLKNVNPFFSVMDGLEDAYDYFYEIFNKGDFEIKIDDNYIHFIISVSFGKKKKEIKISLIKVMLQVSSADNKDEMIKTIQNLSEMLIESNKKNNILEKKFQDLQNKIIHIIETLEIQKEQINKSEELQKNLIKKIELMQIEQSKNLEKIHNSQIKTFEEMQYELLKKIELKNENNNLKIVSVIQQEHKLNLYLNISEILKSEEIPILIDWINTSQFYPNSFKLLYRASEDGKSYNDFHNKCDNKGPTVSFIRTTNGNRFGGFTTHAWDQTGNFKSNDPHCFIFSLDKGTKLSCHDLRYVIYCGTSNGVNFGGSDICISNEFDSTSYAACPYSYCKNEDITTFYLLDNLSSCNFIPEEVEVFRVERN